jgi:D-alanine-D-alanine ligase-like ATP-grasp enzyme
MRVCLLTDEIIEEFNPATHLKSHDWDYVTVLSPEVEFIDEYSRSRQYDVYLNIYEGHDEDANSGLRFVRALEELNLPFTGADSTFYAVTREEMQSTAEQHHIQFARGIHAKSVEDLGNAKNLSYPLIVKHPNSFASIGITRKSRVTNFDELRSQFEMVSHEYGAARIEEFIEGRELSCLIVENADDPKLPFAYSPVEVQFPAGETFLHEDAKWFSWDVFVVPLRDFALSARIQDAARKFFVAMDGSGYARVDVRIRPDGEIVILEINPNCGILYYGPDDRSHADLPISWDPAGHDGFLDRIFRAAIKRQAIRAQRSKNPAL